MREPCSHPRTISYADYLRRGGDPVFPEPKGITDSRRLGWFVCVDCWVLSNDEMELRSGNWPRPYDPEPVIERMGQGVLF